ncbi:MAG: RHS repeat-associated core domain-containing protein [Victivallaceae bacterium]|nr:RHS repeat-associated core domain-containing protein [Victivallaceae bacterium]
MGRRISKKVYTHNGTDWVLDKHQKFVYDNYVQIAEYNAMTTDTLAKSYLRSLNETLLSMIDSTDLPAGATRRYYYNIDGNKNVRSMIDAAGTIVAEYKYAPFGQITSQSGIMATANPFRFSSEYHDDETGLVYYNFRYYSPELGRWLNRDPIKEKGGFNLYGMVGNNPVDYWDWLGLNGFGYDGSDSDKQFDNGGQVPTDFNRRPSTEETQCSNQFDLDDAIERVMVLPNLYLSYLSYQLDTANLINNTMLDISNAIPPFLTDVVVTGLRVVGKTTGVLADIGYNSPSLNGRVNVILASSAAISAALEAAADYLEHFNDIDDNNGDNNSECDN